MNGTYRLDTGSVAEGPHEHTERDYVFEDTTTEPELPELPKVALLLARALTDYVKIEGLPYSNDVRQALTHAARPTGPTLADVVREIQQTGARIAAAFREIARLRTEYPHEIWCPSIDVCAICADSECDGIGCISDLDPNDPDQQPHLTEAEACALVDDLP